jgi:hypothetical protein
MTEREPMEDQAPARALPLAKSLPLHRGLERD